MEIKVDFDINEEWLQINGTIEKCQKKLDAQALKDSNYYCPMESGTLQKSGILNTIIGSGKLVWDTPYAAAQYDGLPNKSHQKNPNAAMRWFEVAKSKNMENWVKLVNDEYIKNNK